MSYSESLEASKTPQGIQDYVNLVTSRNPEYADDNVEKLLECILENEDEKPLKKVIELLISYADETSKYELFLGWTEALTVFPICSDDVELFRYLLNENRRVKCCYDCDNYITISKIEGRGDCKIYAPNVYLYLQSLKELGIKSFGIKLEDQVKGMKESNPGVAF